MRSSVSSFLKLHRVILSDYPAMFRLADGAAEITAITHECATRLINEDFQQGGAANREAAGGMIAKKLRVADHPSRCVAPNALILPAIIIIIMEFRSIVVSCDRPVARSTISNERGNFAGPISHQGIVSSSVGRKSGFVRG